MFRRFACRELLAAASVCSLVLGGAPTVAQSILPTPNPADIPVAVPAGPSLAGSDRPDISRFLSVQTAQAPSPSPDGQRVAFRTRVSGSPQLWVAAVDGDCPLQLTFGEPVTFHKWSPNGEWILYGTDRGGDEREGYYLISPDGLRERELLAPTEAFRVFGSFTRDGRRVVYATTERNGIDFDIHRIDVESGEDRRLLEGRRGLYAAAWRPDGGAVILTEARGEDAQDVYLLELESGDLRPLFTPPIASAYDSFSWRSDGSGFYLATNQDRELKAAAYYDLSARRLEIVHAPEHEVDKVALSSDGSLLAWLENDGGYSRLRLRRTADGEPLTPPELPAGVYDLEWAAAASVLTVHIDGPQLPGDIWLWDVGADAAHRVTRSATAGIDLARLIVPSAHEFTARDGVTLHGLLYAPPGASADDPPPLLLGVHGGPTGQARPGFAAPLQYLMSRGIAFFDLNFRGSTGYGKTFARLNDGRLREGEIYDLEDTVRWLGEEKLADPSRAAVMGGSYGGYLTMAALTRLPDTFRAGVAFVGVSNWITALEGASPELKASDRLEYGDIDDPEEREFFRRISPISHVDNVRSPAMVVHGANDPRDPVDESDQFVRAIRERGGEVEYLRFPDEGHGIRQQSNRVIAYRRVATFLEKHLLDAP